MIPLPLIGLALQAAPSLINMITGSDKAEDITEKTVDVFSAVTGIDVSTADGAQKAAEAIEADPALLAQVTLQLRAIEAEELKAVLSDVADARKRDIQIRHISGGKNTRADLMLSGAFVSLMACVGGSLWLAFSVGLESTQVQLTFGLLNTISGFLMKSLSDVFSYEFGSSRGSKQKSAQLDRLIPTMTEDVPNVAKAVTGAFRSLR